MRCRSCAGFVLAVAAVFATEATAQDVYDLPWRVAENGQLEVRPLADSAGAKELQFGEWMPMFPGLVTRQPDTGMQLAWLGHWGVMHIIPLLVHGDGGAAAIDEATHRMRKLAIPTAIAHAIRQLRPDPLLDLLHIQHLAAADVAIVEFVLIDYAEDGKRDRFVRAAAAEAIAARAAAATLAGHPLEPLGAAEEIVKQHLRRNGAAALHVGLARLPDDIDLVIGIHGAALPRVAPLLAAWRQFGRRFHSTLQLKSGGSISPAQMSTGQLVMDRPGQLPFELAVHFGNWRVDHSLLALRTGEHDHWWFHAGGLFDPERIAEGLRVGNFDVRTANATEVQATVHGFVVHATKTELEAWPEDFDPGRRGANVPTLRDRADAGAAPVWAFVPPASRLAQNAGAAGTTLDVQLDPTKGSVTAIATCADAAAVAKLLASWRSWQDDRRCEPQTKIAADNTNTWADIAALPPGCGEDWRSRLVWRRLLQTVRAEAREATLRWTLDLTPFPLVDLVRMLGESPATILRDR
jgi:hypothetical protein